MPRQPLYACVTCGPSNGVCLACSLSCHAQHTLIELYTKRCGGGVVVVDDDDFDDDVVVVVDDMMMFMLLQLQHTDCNACQCCGSPPSLMISVRVCRSHSAKIILSNFVVIYHVRMHVRT